MAISTQKFVFPYTWFPNKICDSRSLWIGRCYSQEFLHSCYVIKTPNKTRQKKITLWRGNVGFCKLKFYHFQWFQNIIIFRSLPLCVATRALGSEITVILFEAFVENVFSLLYVPNRIARYHIPIFLHTSCILSYCMAKCRIYYVLGIFLTSKEFPWT